MAMIAENWAELLEPGLRAIFHNYYDGLAAESRIPALFNEMDSEKAAEHFLGIGGMGNWPEFGGSIEYDDFTKGFLSTLTHEEYAKGFTVERKLVDDDQYNEINKRPAELGTSAQRTREIHAAGVFNNAFSGSYLGADGKALCATDHPWSPTNATAQSNAGTSALTYANVVATRLAMRAFVDQRGNLMSINPNLILVPPELEETANAIVKTMRDGQPQIPDTADAHANIVPAWGISYLTWDYLTDPNNWFMLDMRLAKIHLMWIDRVMLEFALDPTSGYDLVARYRGYMRYSYGWDDYKWVYGHAVT